MNIHKRTRLTLLDRQEIWRLYQTRLWKVVHLAERFHVSRPTIYDVLKRARLQEFTPRDSTNQRFKTLQYGLKRLAKVEHKPSKNGSSGKPSAITSLTRVNWFISIPSDSPY